MASEKAQRRATFVDMGHDLCDFLTRFGIDQDALARIGSLGRSILNLSKPFSVWSDFCFVLDSKQMLLSPKSALKKNLSCRCSNIKNEYTGQTKICKRMRSLSLEADKSMTYKQP